ncbi:MAG: Bax inhibitor-1/YccA family protein [Nocardioides sp.]
MRSNNPIFNRSEQFQPGGQAAYPGAGASVPQYGQPMSDPSTWGTGTPVQPEAGAPMTIDSVVQKTAISLGIVIAVAFATWWWIGDVVGVGGLVNSDNYGQAMLAVIVGSLGAFALSMVNSFKRVVSPPLVIAFCVLEGVALGAISKVFDAQFRDGVVSGAVLGTFAAFAGTLAAYKYFNISLGAKARKIVIGAVLGMVALSLMELVLGMFGNALGLFGVSALGMVTAFLGVILGVFMLIMDFEFVEQGVANGIEERESWRAAFAMTVSLVWIYTNLLRILAFFSSD